MLAAHLTRSRTSLRHTLPQGGSAQTQTKTKTKNISTNGKNKIKKASPFNFNFCSLFQAPGSFLIAALMMLIIIGLLLPVLADHLLFRCLMRTLLPIAARKSDGVLPPFRCLMRTFLPIATSCAFLRLTLFFPPAVEGLCVKKSPCTPKNQ